MSGVHLGQIDLNLLRVFDALAEERNATRAGDRLGLSQSAVSHALGRMRQLFGDPLFVRGPDGMRPTARAAEMAPALREALVQLQLAISPGNFSPGQTDRPFVIAGGAYMTAVLLPAVVERIRLEAPRAEVRMRAMDSGLEEALRRGTIDVAVGVFADLSDRFEREPLFEESAVWVVRAGHPAARSPLSLEGLADIPQVVVTVGSEDEQDSRVSWGRIRLTNALDYGVQLDELLARAGLKRTVVLRVHDIYGALSVVSRTDMTVLAPRRLAEMHAQALGLTLLDAPHPSGVVVGETVWSREAGGQPAVEWLRSVLREAAAQI